MTHITLSEPGSMLPMLVNREIHPDLAKTIIRILEGNDVMAEDDEEPDATISESTAATVTKYEVFDSGTRYVAYVTEATGVKVISIETGWGSNYGQWIMLGQRSVAWHYLAEKMPGLREGDRPGYTLLLAKIGIEVF